MALCVHRAERSDTLAAALADVMAVPLTDPFAEEVVAVPARGELLRDDPPGGLRPPQRVVPWAD